jgi:hypothetical protein
MVAMFVQGGHRGETIDIPSSQNAIDVDDMAAPSSPLVKSTRKSRMKRKMVSSANNDVEVEDPKAKKGKVREDEGR